MIVVDWIPDDLICDRNEEGFKMKDLICRRIPLTDGKFSLLKYLPDFIPNLDTKWRKDLARKIPSWLTNRRYFPEGVAIEVIS